MTTKSYEFFFPINWYGHTFNEMELKFNCNMTIVRIYRGQQPPVSNPDPSQLPPSNIGFQLTNNSTNDIIVDFPLVVIEQEGVILSVQTNSPVPPEIAGVTLSMKGQNVNWPYLAPYLQNLNNLWFPNR